MLMLAAGAISQSNVDSLKFLLNTDLPDSSRIDIFLELSEKVDSLDLALTYSLKAEEIARQSNLKNRQARALKNLGLFNNRKGEYAAALDYYQEGLQLFRATNDLAGVSNILNNMGAIYNAQGDDAKALEYFLESLRYGEESKNTLRIATALLNVGTVYMKKAQTYKEAIEILKRAIPQFEKIDYQLGVGVVCVNLGEILLNQGKVDSALLYLEESREIFTDISVGFLSFSLNLIGKSYIAKGDYAAAIKTQQKAIQVAKERESQLELAHAYLGLADSYSASGRLLSAQDNYFQAEDLYKEMGMKEGLKDVYKGLANTYERFSDFRNAYQYHQLYSNYKDSVYNIATSDEVRSLRFTYELEKKEAEIEILNRENELAQAKIERSSILRNFLFATAGFLIITIGGISYQYWYARKSNKIISEERNRSESILLNILPVETAEELKANGYVEAKKFDLTTVLFSDFKEFTKSSENHTPEELVKSIDYYFRHFDEIVTRFGLEKIKTIGDAYMCAGGLPVPNTTNPVDTVRAGLEMVAFVEQVKKEPPLGIIPFEVRIGVSTGPVVAGVVGTKKFQYDIWGETVNVASIMETNSFPGKITISETTYACVKDEFVCLDRGEIAGKHGGRFKMYFVEGAKMLTF